MAGQLVAIQAFDANGIPVPGAKFFTYDAGTLIPKPAYADEAGTIALSNPVVLNASGLGACWLKSGIGDYKIAMKTPDEATFLLRTIDNFSPLTSHILYIVGSDIESARSDALDAAAAAQLAQSLAETAATNAVASAAAASASANNAAASEAGVAANAATATTQAGNAAASAAAASASQTAAAGSATAASGSAAAAAGSATTATTQATNAGTSATLAQDWAAKPFGLDVVGVGTRSALHQAQTAQDWALVADNASATARQLNLGSHASDAVAAALPYAVIGAFYFNTTTAELRRLLTLTPPTSSVIAEFTTQDQDNLDALGTGRIENTLSATTLVIDGAGAVTATRAAHVLDAASGSADDLVTYDMTAFVTGSASRWRAATGDTITVKTSGSLRTRDGLDLVVTGRDWCIMTKEDDGTITASIGGSTPDIDTVDTLAALRALTANEFDAVVMLNRATAEDNGHGLFDWLPGNQSARVTADPLFGLFVPPNSDATGASGVWARRFSGPAVAAWFGVVPGTVTVADWNSMLVTIGTITGLKTRELLLDVGVYTFHSKPAIIVNETRIVGGGLSNTNLVRNYSEAGGNEVAFIHFKGEATANSHVSDLQLSAGAGTTGGAMLKWETNVDEITSWGDVDRIVISPASGNYAWAVVVDGTLNTLGGSQGLRDLRLRDSFFFTGTVGSLLAKNATNNAYTSIWCSGAVTITGGGTAATDTNDLRIEGLACLGTLTLENCNRVSVQGSTNALTIAATALASTFIGSIRGTEGSVTNASSTSLAITQFGIYSGGAAANGFTIINRTDDVNAGPYLNLKRLSATPANGDNIARVAAIAGDAGGVPTEYASIGFQIADTTDGSEDGVGQLIARRAGALNVKFTWGGGFYANGLADMGDGTGNFTEVYKNGVAVGGGATNPLELTLVDAGSASGPDINLRRDSASPANGDNLGVIRFYGRDSANNYDPYAYIIGTIVDATSTSEDGTLQFGTAVAGAFATRGYFQAGLVVGSPTGADKGVGTVNAVGVYDDNVLLTDYVFDLAFDGALRPEDADNEKAAAFDPAILDLDAFEQRVRAARALPGFVSRREWTEETRPAVGDLLQRVWEIVEVQAVHIAKLNARLKSLEAPKRRFRWFNRK